MTNKTILIAILLASFSRIHSITSKDSFYPKDFRRHASPPTDWEAGLREAAHQALRRERNSNPNLREDLITAPMLGKEHQASPFGDIALLARGQLFSTPNGYRFIRDAYQNDCLDCHEKRPCRHSECDYYKPRGSERLMALWTVKRIRHRDPHFGHRYELEYTISPISAGLREGFVRRNGEFDYSVPGHVFVVKSNPKGAGHNFYKVYKDYTNNYFNPYGTTEATHYHQQNPGYVEGDRLSHPHFDKPYTPNKVNGHPGHPYPTPNNYYLPQTEGNKFTHYVPHYYEKPSSTTPTGVDNNEDELELFQNLLQSLAQQTSTTQYKPTKVPHRFGPPTQATKPLTHPTKPFAFPKPQLTPVMIQPTEEAQHHTQTKFTKATTKVPTTLKYPKQETSKLTTFRPSQPIYTTNPITKPTTFRPSQPIYSQIPTDSVTTNYPASTLPPKTTIFIPVSEIPEPTTGKQNEITTVYERPSSLHSTETNRPTTNYHTNPYTLPSNYPTEQSTFLTNQQENYPKTTPSTQQTNQIISLPIRTTNTPLNEIETTHQTSTQSKTTNTPYITEVFSTTQQLPSKSTSPSYFTQTLSTMKHTENPNEFTNTPYIEEIFPTMENTNIPSKTTNTPYYSTQKTNIPTYVTSTLPQTTYFTTTRYETTKPVPTFFIDPTHSGYPKTTPTTPFTEGYVETDQTHPTTNQFISSPIYVHYSETDPTYHSTIPITKPATQTIPTTQNIQTTQNKPTIQTTLILPTDRYIPPTTPQYITVPSNPPKENTPFRPPSRPFKPPVSPFRPPFIQFRPPNKKPADDYEEIELFPDDEKSPPITNPLPPPATTVSPKPTEGFLLRDDDYVPHKKDSNEDVELFEATSVKPETSTARATIDTKEIDEVFNSNLTSKPVSNEEEFEDFFVQEPSKSTPTQATPTKVTNSFEDLFDVKSATERTRATNSPIEESTTQGVKIIYSDFFMASTVSPTTNLDAFTTPFTAYVPTTSLLTTPPTLSTTLIENTNSINLPSTSQSFSTSVTIEVNRNTTSKSPVSLKYRKAKVTQVKPATVNDFVVYKAESAQSTETRVKQTPLNDENRSLDDLALSIVNHARSIDYLENKNKKPKYRRKTYSRPRKLKKRVE